MSAIFWTVQRVKKAEEILSQPDGSYTKVADYFRGLGHNTTRNSVAGMCTKYGIKIDRATRKLTWAAKGAVTSIKARNAEKKDKAETKRRVKEAVSVIKKIRDHDAVYITQRLLATPKARNACCISPNRREGEAGRATPAHRRVLGFAPR